MIFLQYQTEMLRFPLPPIPDPNIHLGEINFETHQQLCRILDENDKWKKVKAMAEQLMDHDPSGGNLQRVADIHNTKELLALFDRFNCNVQVLAYLLQCCGFEEPLYLLKDREPAVIVEQPSRKNGGQVVCKLEEEVLLCCSASGFPEPKYQWICDGKLLHDQTNSRLIISNFRVEQIGIYHCEVSQQLRDGSMFTVSSQPVNVLLEYCTPAVLEEPKSQDVHVGQPLELQCVAKGYPDLSYQWYKDDHILENGTKSGFKVEKVDSKDQGTYCCHISNLHGKVWTKEAFVTVLEWSPYLKITQQPCFPNNAPVQTGSILNLSCEVIGEGPISYQWYCNNILLEGKVQAHLQWKALPFEGNILLGFRCTITNRHGSIETDLVTTVVDTSTSQSQHKASIKLALLIGNWTYRHMDEMIKVMPDVCTLHNILENQMDFHVVSLANLCRSELRNALDKFCELIIPGAYVLVYFAGHGVHHQVWRSDYLLPVDVPPVSEYAIGDMIDKDEIIAKIQTRDPKLLVLLLDMCRRITHLDDSPRLYADGPYQDIRFEPRRNLVIGFATSETRAALENLSKPNGLFMTFLKSEIHQRIRVDQMLHSVMRRFNLESTGIVLQQIPTTTTYLAEDLSLHDPVDGQTIGNNTWNAVVRRIRSWQELPGLHVAMVPVGPVEVYVHLRYRPMSGCFLNGLEVHLSWDIPEQYDTTYEFAICPPTLQINETERKTRVGHRNDCLINVVNLQTLKPDEEASLMVAIGEGQTWLPLGRPLIAKADLASNHL